MSTTALTSYTIPEEQQDEYYLQSWRNINRPFVESRLPPLHTKIYPSMEKLKSVMKTCFDEGFRDALYNKRGRFIQQAKQKLADEHYGLINQLIAKGYTEEDALTAAISVFTEASQKLGMNLLDWLKLEHNPRIEPGQTLYDKHLISLECLNNKLMAAGKPIIASQIITPLWNWWLKNNDQAMRARDFSYYDACRVAALGVLNDTCDSVYMQMLRSSLEEKEACSWLTAIYSEARSYLGIKVEESFINADMRLGIYQQPADVVVYGAINYLTAPIAQSRSR